MVKLISKTAFLLSLALIFSVGVKADTTTAPLSNACILIIRHAERTPDGPGLTPAGQQRAQAYIKYFESFQIDSKLRQPDYLIAAADSTKSTRTRLTLEPLGKAMNLSLDVRFKNKHIDDLVTELTQHPTGKTILICWHHEKIPDLLKALGADPNALLPQGAWPEDVYGWVIELRYDSGGHLIASQSKRINEHLFPDDDNPDAK